MGHPSVSQAVRSVVEAAQAASTVTGLAVLITFVDADDLRTIPIPPYGPVPGQACLLCGMEH